MKMFKRTALFTVISFALVGCKEDKKEEIVEAPKPTLTEQVKGYVYEDIDPTLTVGAALETRGLCEKVDWETAVDARGRDTLVYTCVHKGYDVFFDNLEADRLAERVVYAEEQLPLLKEEAEDTARVFAEQSQYLTFLEQLEEKNLLTALAEIKKANSDISITSYIPSFVKIEEGAQIESFLAERTPEEKEAFQGVFDIIHALLGGEGVDRATLLKKGDEFNALLIDNGFELVIEDIVGGASSKELVDVLKQTVASLSEDNDAAKSKVEITEFQLTQEGFDNFRRVWERDRPADIISTITFAMGKDKPYPIACDVTFYGKQNPAAPAYIKSFKGIYNGEICLEESYGTQYTKFFSDIIGEFYQSNID